MTLAPPLEIRPLQSCIARLRTHRGPLLICGGGQDPLGLIRPLFVGLAGGRAARIAVVPVASTLDATRLGYTGLLKSLGASDVWMVDPEGDQADHPAVEAALRCASGICITGGDQKRLARSLSSTLTVRVLSAQLSAGTPVYTTSASSAALSDVMVAGLDDDDRVRVQPGLGILPGLTFETHLNTRNRHARLDDLVAREVNTLIVGIDENTALLFAPGTCRATVLGIGEVVVMGRRVEASRYHSGEVIDLEVWSETAPG